MAKALCQFQHVKDGLQNLNGEILVSKILISHQPRSSRPSNVDDDIVCNLVDTNPRISTQIVAKKLKIDRSTTFRHLKNLDTI